MTYEQLDYRTVRVRKAKFVPEPEGEYTLKLEAARVTGYQSSFIGAFRDPILISQLDTWLPAVRKIVDSRMSGGFEYETKFVLYGINGVMGRLEPNTSLPKEVGILVQCKAATQEQSFEVANRTKMAITHAPYPGQLATGGNFAWPITPCETANGPVPEFCMYHLIHKADPLAPFPIKMDHFHGSNTFIKTPCKSSLHRPFQDLPPADIPCSTDKRSGPEVDPAIANTHAPSSTPKGPQQPRKYCLQPAPPAGTSYLGDHASILRSKIAGPYQSPSTSSSRTSPRTTASSPPASSPSPLSRASTASTRRTSLPRCGGSRRWRPRPRFRGVVRVRALRRRIRMARSSMYR